MPIENQGNTGVEKVESQVLESKESSKPSITPEDNKLLTQSRIDSSRETQGMVSNKILGDLELVEAKPKEFTNDLGDLNKKYVEAGLDTNRQGTFQDRMFKMYGNDPEGFKELSKVGKLLNESPAPSPEDVGKNLADVVKNGVERNIANGGVGLLSPEMVNMQAALSGTMLAARANFSPDTMAQQTTALVDSMEAQLKQQNVANVHAIIWGDTKEPGVIYIPDSVPIADRHNFSAPKQ